MPTAAPAPTNTATVISSTNSPSKPVSDDKHAHPIHTNSNAKGGHVVLSKKTYDSRDKEKAPIIDKTKASAMSGGMWRNVSSSTTSSTTAAVDK